MRKLLSLDETRATPLLKGPFVSLSRAFAAGASVENLAADGARSDALRPWRVRGAAA